jgi:hypothetical protein
LEADNGSSDSKELSGPDHWLLVTLIGEKPEDDASILMRERPITLRESSTSRISPQERAKNNIEEVGPMTREPQGRS